MKTQRLTLVALSAVLLAVAAQGKPGYRVVDLGHLAGSQGSSEACAISSDGRVTGSAINAQGREEQFYWDRATVMIGLGQLPTTPGTGCGQGVNNQGVVVGSYFANGTYWPTIWDRDRGLRLLPAFKGEYGTGQAYGINDLGQIVGENSKGNVHHACLWDPHLGLIDLGTLPGDLHSKAFAIDNHGTITGNSQGNPANVAAKAFLWEFTTGMKNLGQLQPGFDSEGRGVNTTGNVIGSSFGQPNRGFYWSPAGGMVTIASTTEALFSLKAFGMNNTDTAVGQMVTIKGQRGFVWTKSQGVVDLTKLLVPTDKDWVIVNAEGINDEGWIAGTGLSAKNATQHAVLLIPVLLP